MFRIRQLSKKIINLVKAINDTSGDQRLIFSL